MTRKQTKNLELADALLSLGRTPEEAKAELVARHGLHAYGAGLLVEAASKAASPKLSATPAAPSKRQTGSAWCRHCHGPVADGSGDCGECR